MIESDMRNIVIDLGNLDYLYSDTINAFIASNRHMLEVSGRIAILTEHPKVQDILKRAGLDNIMRIYRSEAEMIADSKEILRQTSGYRVDDIQNQGGYAQPVEPARPKTEFDDFRSVIGDQLGAKLDNNEVPQHQYGGNAPGTAPRFAPPPSAAAQQPYAGFPQAPQAQAYPQPGTQPPANFGGYTQPPAPPQFGGGYAMPSTPEPASQGFPPTGNFDFPTVQMPAGGYAGFTPPPAPATPGPIAAPEPSDDGGAEERNRKAGQDRMRNPSGKKQMGRRVGGRNEQPGAEEDGSAPSSLPAQEAHAASGYAMSAPESKAPPATPVSKSSNESVPYPLDSGKKSSSMMPVFVVILLLALGGGAAYYFLVMKKPVEVASTGSGQETPTPGTDVTPPTPPTEPVAREPKTEPKTEPVPEPKTEVKPETKPEPKTETKTEAKTQVKPETKPEAKPAAAKVPPGSLAITSNPPGADVLINFSKKGVTPITLKLTSNSNRIIVKLPGYKKFEVSVSKNTKDRNLNVELEPEGGSTPVEPKPEPKVEAKPEPKVEPKPEPKVEPKPEPKVEVKPEPKVEPVSGGAPGTIFLSSSPARAEIIVDGKPTDKVTPTKLELSVGNHRIEMVKEGLKASVEQNITAGKNKALHLQLH